jgi:hypothetical protein
LTLATGCAGTVDVGQSRAALQVWAESAGFRAVHLGSRDLPLVVFVRDATGDVPDDTVTVYIEGDGRSWATRTRAARNPTPADPLGFRIAARQTEGAVAYVGRPCQFIDRPVPACRPDLWTAGRFGAQALGIVSRGVDRAKASVQARRIVLAGYSGGGTLAALLAAARRDTVRLVTIAAPLDTVAWTAWHRVSPLSSSRNPTDVAGLLAAIEQIHFGGSRDRVVPPEVNAAFFDALPPGTSATRRVIERFDHTCCWVQAWRELYRSGAASATAKH